MRFYFEDWVMVLELAIYYYIEKSGLIFLFH